MSSDRSRDYSLRAPSPKAVMMPWLWTRIRSLRCDGDISRCFTVTLHPPPPEHLYNKWYCYSIHDSPNKPPRQRDPVLALMVRVMLELNIQDMFFSASWVEVINATSSPPLWPPNACNRDCFVKLYCFKYEGHNSEFPMTVPVRLANQNANLTEDNVLIKVPKGDWTPLRQALLATCDRDYLDSPKRRICTQQEWWQRRKQPFRFMDLPTEIRRMVLENALGHRHTTDPAANSSLKISPRLRLILYAWQPPKLTMGYTRCGEENEADPNYALFRVSKHIRAEAFIAGWESAWKHFATPERFLTAIQHTHPPATYNWLNKIELAFRISEWFEFIGVEHDTDMAVSFNSTKCRGPDLQAIATLRSLRIHFQLPSADRFEAGTLAQLAVSVCSRTATSWILSALYPYINHIPAILLSGAIKTPVRRHWERIFKYRVDEWQEHRDRLVDQRPLPSRLHECKCAMPCATCMCDLNDMIFAFDGPHVFDHDDEFTPELFERLWTLARVRSFRRVEMPKVIPFGGFKNVDQVEEQFHDHVVAEREEERRKKEEDPECSEGKWVDARVLGLRMDGENVQG